MPSNQLDFRASCGAFLPVFLNFMWKRTVRAKAMRCSMLTVRSRPAGVLLGFVILLMFWGDNLLQHRGREDLLMRSGDVESNPGPNPDSNTSSSSSASLRQTRLSTSQGSHAKNEPSLADILSTIKESNSTMNGKLDGIKTEVSGLREECGALHELVSGLRDEVKNLRAQNELLQQKNNDLTTRLDDLELKFDDIENRSRRNNLIFYGIKKEEGETRDKCEETVQNLIKDKLKIEDKVEFDRVHRLNSKSDSPIIARCSFFKQKVQILKSKTNLKGANIFIGEDFSLRIRDIRRKLTPFLKKARSDGKRVSMVHDHLFIDGRKFGLSRNESLVEIK